MELKDQVCSLELAKRLKELGVKQESLFYWYYLEVGISSYENGDSYPVFDDVLNFGKIKNEDDNIIGSAFTVAELGVMMPSIITRNKSIAREFANKNVYIYEVQYSDINQSTISSEATEADARAKMLIYLLENSLVKVEDINE